MSILKKLFQTKPESPAPAASTDPAPPPAQPADLPPGPPPPGSPERGISDMVKFLENLRALGFQPASILDVGANYGLWSAEAIKIFPEARFCLIEPQDEMRQHLDYFCRSHRGARWVQAGAGAEPGELIQTIWKDLAGSSFLPEVNPELLAKGGQRKTPIVTIDYLYPAGEPLPELAKLDIQGFELEALKGARSLFGRTEIFILEASLFRFYPKTPLVSELIAFMHERGYELYDIAGHLRRPVDGALGQLDLVFAREGGFFRKTNDWLKAP